MNDKPAGSEFTPEDRNLLLNVIRRGCDRTTAAGLIGISASQLRRHLEHDPELATQLCKAEAQAEFRHMETVHHAAEKVENWRACVWWLERRAPERFHRRAFAITKHQLEAFVDGLMAAITSETEGEVRGRLTSRLHKLIASFAQRHSVEAMTGPDADDEPAQPLPHGTDR